MQFGRLQGIPEVFKHFGNRSVPFGVDWFNKLCTCFQGNTTPIHKRREVLFSPGGGGGTPLCDFNGDVRPDRVWFSGCFVLNGVSISSLSVLNRVSLHYLMA